jgi:hypothetical protein
MISPTCQQAPRLSTLFYFLASFYVVSFFSLHNEYLCSNLYARAIKPHKAKEAMVLTGKYSAITKARKIIIKLISNWYYLI